MYKFMSNYYEKEITLCPRDKKTLFNLYTQVSKNKKFEPEVDSHNEINSETFDHVAYHVEKFGKDLNGFKDIEHLLLK